MCVQYGAGLTFSSGSEYGVVDQDGYYTYEVNELVTFSFGNSQLTRNPTDSNSIYDFSDTSEGQAFIDMLILKDVDNDLSNGIQSN